MPYYLGKIPIHWLQPCANPYFISLDHICFISTNVRVFNVWLWNIFFFVSFIYCHITGHHDIIMLIPHKGTCPKTHQNTCTPKDACSLNIIICWYLCIVLYEYWSHFKHTRTHPPTHVFTHPHTCTHAHTYVCFLK